MTIKSTSGRFAGRFRGGPIFPNLMFRPNQGMFPFMGRRRFNVGGVLARRFQPAKVYGRLGCLEVRLARKRGEIRRAQRLRYKVFYEEMSAVPDALAPRVRVGAIVRVPLHGRKVRGWVVEDDVVPAATTGTRAPTASTTCGTRGKVATVPV